MLRAAKNTYTNRIIIRFGCLAAERGIFIMKQLLSGNEAIARGIWEAGIKVASAYPGTPSTEVLENLPQYKDDIYCEWAPNEKVALEVAYGAAIAGSRSVTAMKMVGLNVAADPFFTASYLGVKGGFIIVNADDPSMHSSQNEQDNRYYARAAKVPLVEPADSQDCKDFVRIACEISEKFDTPVLFRTTTRISHSKSLVELGKREEHPFTPYARDSKKYVCTPANSYAKRPLVEQRLRDLEEFGYDCPLNKLEMRGTKIGVISASVAYEYAKEVFPEDASFLKLGLTFPLPMRLIREFAEKVETLYVVEELEPFMEDQIKAAGIKCTGKQLTGTMYEMNTQLLRERIFGTAPEVKIPEVTPVPRPPALCPGCPHRGFFYAMSRRKNVILTGDIGCYTLGGTPPLNALDSVVCMGAGFTVAMGMSKAFEREGVTDKLIFGCLGDSTFCHSGLTGAAEIIYNKGNVIPVVLDNRITGMTGQQDNPASGYTLLGEPSNDFNIDKVLGAMGFIVMVVDPLDLKAMNETIDSAIALKKEGKFPAIVTRRPCVLLKRMPTPKKLCTVDPEKCRACRMCLGCGCPAIALKDGKAFIDANQCIGCTVCAQICPFGAIS